jgi:hypothetical protein
MKRELIAVGLLLTAASGVSITWHGAHRRGYN